MRTPKLKPVHPALISPGSKYYAGFGRGFVEDVIRRLELKAGNHVIDCWNGSGTTTVTTADLGLTATGTDVNPALVIVGKSKLLGSDVLESLHPLTTEILNQARRDVGSPKPRDPLAQWFTAGTAAYLRSIEQSIQQVLVHPARGIDLGTEAGLEQVSALAASFYVVLFETVRSLLWGFKTTNPTWIKTKAGTDLSVTKNRIDEKFRTFENRQHQRLLQLGAERRLEGRAAVRLASSTAIPLADNSADACIASPPYLTRIDYVVLTRPELAVLGVQTGDVRRLRQHSIGTPTMWEATPEVNEAWGTYTKSLVRKIEAHPSKASKTYYKRFFVQYFDSMHRSMAELRRVLDPAAPCALVVQDSFYKDVHVDLARSLQDLGQNLGWNDVVRHDFKVSQNRAQMNPNSRIYRTNFDATESLLIFTS